jgi:5-enolpyruvylshikimate-3-phosphate synthase
MAALIASGETTISRAECMDDSFPGFAPLLASLLEAAP